MTAFGVKQISGRDRLFDMPAVFTASDLRLRYGWSNGTVQVSLCRWHRRDGFIRPLGGKSEVYFNLLVDPRWQAHYEVALRRAVTHVITIGQSVYSHGWTSQIPNIRHLAVTKEVSIYAIDGCQFHVRRSKWFLAVGPGVQFKTHTIPELRPAWALADALLAHAAYRTGFLPRPKGVLSLVPSPDELYVDDCTTGEIADFVQAIECLKDIYGFSELPMENACPNMRAAYAAAHAAVFASPDADFQYGPRL